MKLFELIYLCVEPLLSPLHRQVRSHLVETAKTYPQPPDILDVGGRKSHYTIGVPANITITDLARTTNLQERRHLGIDEEIVQQTYKRRSNIRRILVDDMTKSALPEHSLDFVVAVEVLEHVEDDASFLSEIHRVLRPGGKLLMTTPNGDFLKVPFGDHKRHYTQQQLHSLLTSFFRHVEVEYAIKAGRYRFLGSKHWSIKHPWQTVLSMVGNFINSIQSASSLVKSQPTGTLHLIAVASKGGSNPDLRRLAPRSNTRVPVRMLTNHAPPARHEASAKGQTRNVSATGLAFCLPESGGDWSLFNNADCSAWIQLELPTGPIQLRVARIRSEPIQCHEAGENCLVGTKIVEMGARSRASLIEYLCTLSLKLTWIATIAERLV